MAALRALSQYYYHLIPFVMNNQKAESELHVTGHAWKQELHQQVEMQPRKRAENDV